MNITSVFLNISNEIANIMQERMPYLNNEVIDSVAADLGDFIVGRAAANQGAFANSQPIGNNAAEALPERKIAPMCGNCMSESCLYTISVGSDECIKRFKPVRLLLV